MKHRAKNILRGMAKHLGLKVKFVDYFPDDVHGKLLPREKRILLNAHKPRYEHEFTLLHEIGHFLNHFKNPDRKRHPRIFDIRWEFDFWAKLSSFMRRYWRYVFNKESGKEWEADLWAMCAFVYLARYFGSRDLLEFLNHHPEKNGMFWLAIGGVVYSDIKKRIATTYKFLLNPFRAG
jgi:hypothetical protein